MSKAVLLAINAKYVHSSLEVWLLAGGVCLRDYLRRRLAFALIDLRDT